LTGKHRSGAPETGTRFDGNQTYLDRYWNQVNLEAVTKLSTIAAGAGRPLVSLALNWLLHHTWIDCAVLGASRLEQLEENLRALDDGPLDQSSIMTWTTSGEACMDQARNTTADRIFPETLCLHTTLKSS
jgi:aryl-alcohol dehydrogenase-like predicted oxidoreductase